MCKKLSNGIKHVLGAPSCDLIILYLHKYAHAGQVNTYTNIQTKQTKSIVWIYVYVELLTDMELIFATVIEKYFISIAEKHKILCIQYVQ